MLTRPMLHKSLSFQSRTGSNRKCKQGIVILISVLTKRDPPPGADYADETMRPSLPRLRRPRLPKPILLPPLPRARRATGITPIPRREMFGGRATSGKCIGGNARGSGLPDPRAFSPNREMYGGGAITPRGEMRGGRAIAAGGRARYLGGDRRGGRVQGAPSPLGGRYKSTWKREFKIPWREAGLLKLSRWLSGFGPVGCQ